MSETDTKINEFITKYRAETEIYTHVSVLPPRGRYCFSRNELDLFWDLYCDVLSDACDHENKPPNNVISGLAEMPQEYSMLVVDADLKSICPTEDKEQFEHLYTYEQVSKLISIYQSVMKSRRDVAEGKFKKLHSLKDLM